MLKLYIFHIIVLHTQRLIPTCCVMFHLLIIAPTCFGLSPHHIENAQQAQVTFNCNDINDIVIICFMSCR